MIKLSRFIFFSLFSAAVRQTELIKKYISRIAEVNRNIFFGRRFSRIFREKDTNLGEFRGRKTESRMKDIFVSHGNSKF